MHRTTVRLDEHLLAQAKEYAVRHRRSLTSVIEDALRSLLFKGSTASKRRRAKIITYGKGGTLPGVPSLDCYGEVVEWMEKDLPLDQRR